MAAIVAIGGGQVFVPCQPPTTLAIDQEIVRLGRRRLKGDEKRRPRVLFVPTASGDDLGYCHGVYNVYGVRLGCDFDHLRFLAESLSDKQVADRINWADIIYVGGGNTLKMMNAWRRRGVDKLLVAAYKEGKVMCGLSAGAICWFSWGCSDSRKKDGQEKFKLIRVAGLGLLPQAVCPHWDSESGWRQTAFPEMLKFRSGDRDLGLAVEDNCAFEVVDRKMRLICSQPGKSAYCLWWGNELDGIFLRQEALSLSKAWRDYQFGFAPLLPS